MPFPVERNLIERAERELGVSFPANLVDRLLRNNGGEVDADEDTWELHPVLDDSDQKRISRTSSHMVRETAAAREWQTFPPDAIAIADNGTGDKLVLLRDASARADVFYRWDHETGQLHAVAIEFDPFRS